MTPPSGDSPSPLSPAELSGTTLDRYKLETLLGAGGMGRVYSAIQTVTQRRCALKLLPDELCKNADFVSRFQTEAQMLARLNHPNIVQIYSGGEAQSRFFLEMEYVDGGDLQKRVTEQTQGPNKGLAEAEVVRVTDGVLAALEYAHQHGIIHRDLKPANILLSKDGNVKVSDFGLATVIGEQHHRGIVEASMTSFSLAKVTSMETIASTPAESASSFAGTILYMSPQALRAEPADARDDLFSLGVVVYYMLTGKTPAVNYTPVSRVRRDLKYKWDPFIATCLGEERASRYANASAARAAFAKLRSTRSKWLMAAAVGLLLVVPASAFVVWRNASTTASRVAASAQSVQSPPSKDRPADAANSGVAVQGADDHGTPEVSAKGSASVSTPVLAAAERRPQSITVPPFGDALLGQTLELAAQSDSGLPVKVSVVSGPAVIRGDHLELHNLGKVALRFVQPGDATFLPADPVEKTFEVQDPLPAHLTLTLPGQVEMNFVRVPAGQAVLGSPDGETGRDQNETLHEFVLPNGFLMSATEVTQAAYEALTGTRPSYFRSDWQMRPVDQVRWTDLGGYNTGATSGFLPKLNAFLRDNGFAQWEASLPTEDEWEYACRAGSSSAFGNDVDLAVPRDEASIQRLAVFGQSETARVGSKAPNAWGLFDMHGNVAEWTREGTLRGGSFRDDPSSIRSAARFRSPSASVPDRRFGFRIVLRRID
ncbi:MAG: bifunctional serine/threonine-protein kinase/formylglycine-generating enzyme family protein [Opitutus sp.]